MIKRTKYLDKIIPFIDKPLIKALVGVRRSGKTVLLTQLKEHLLDNGISENQIVYINFESFVYRKYLNGETLYQHVIDKYEGLGGKKIYLFFDEIQDVSEWEKILASFLVDINCDIYITGSNSKLLSGELATHIAGRHVHFDIYPFTFTEVRAYAKELGRDISDEALFNEYIEFGGLPQCCSLPEKQSKQTYLEDIFNTIVVNDIVERNKISDIDLLKRIIVFLLDNIGNPFSANSICKALKSEGINTTVNTVVSYVSYILKALVICSVKRYDTKGKALLSTNEKYYSVDLGIRNHIKSSELIDYSKLFENVVYLEMLSRGYEINVGKVGEYEIDFICYNRDKEKIYIQVAYLLSDESTIEREFRPFSYIDDNYPKYVISADMFDFSRNGIKHYNIIDFLLNT
ncbi:MAG: ATP-binding protein [Clostridia bacterium]|nr:ATP-binding protein [Clostridia bacterium]